MRFVVRRLHFQLGTVLGFALLLSEAAAQCCRRSCPRPKVVYQNQKRPGGVIVARGTLQPSKPSGATTWDVVGAKPVCYDGLGLKIISGTAQRRLATVNNQTFLAGETLRVTVRDNTLRVHCLEIRERSVLVEVEGETSPRELKLRAWR